MAVIYLTAADFETVTKEGTVLLDFFATWCGPCKMVAPILDQLAEENPDKKICKIDVDQEPALAERFGVMSIPTLLLMKDGVLMNKMVGAASKKKLEEFLNQ
ncbi:MAG: thioredoxin [Clostridia bacterium]|nr:thioredoxin [Clostridia bacterium]